jgi:hypothetical protein
MNFKEFYKINERTIGLNSQELDYVDTLMERIKENCVTEFWELGYAGLKSLDNFDNKGFGLIIHDFEQEPFPDLRISVYAYSEDRNVGSFIHEPYVSTVPYKRSSSPRSRFAKDYIFTKKLVDRSLIEITVPLVGMPERLKWVEKNFFIKFLLKKLVMPTVVGLRSVLEHELIHYKDPSISIEDKNPEGTSTINYYDKGKGYYTSGGENSGGVPTEFYPRIWTIIRNCKNEQDKQELIDWIKKPVPILPKCMEKETDFVKYTWENPSLRRMFLRKLYDGIVGKISPGKTTQL